MKKVLKSIFAIMVCVVSLFAFAGCGKTSYSATTNTTTNVESNGGLTVTYGEYIYFINGTKTNNEANNKGEIVQGAICKAKLDENGKIVEDSTSVVVDRLVGFDDGQLFIFGDFLYYTTPCRDKNKAAEMLYDKTEFRRYDLKKNKDQLIYTTTASSDTITFTYYKDGENLDLVVYEKTSATLKSIRIGNEMKTLFTKENVKSAIVSDNSGEVKEGATSYADQYIFYTLSYDENSANKNGVRVFKIKADGTGEQKISEGETVTLLTIRSGRLVYSKDSHIYASNISTAEDSILDDNIVISYNSYDNIIFLEDDSNTILVVDGDTLRTISWKTGSIEDKELYSFSSGDNVKFIGVDGDYLFYQYSKIVYKIKFKNATDDEIDPIKLSTTSIDEASELIAPELNGGYIYGMYTDSSSKLTYLYRINTQTPKELDEKDDDGKFKTVGEAEFIGIKE